MKLEDWNTVLQFASAVLLGLTFAIGAGAIFTGYMVGKRQEVRIAATEHGTAEANKNAAEAGEGTAKALAEAAAANERSQRLESGNLALRGQVAGLEKEAAEAKRRQAEAEIQLAEIKKEQEPRGIFLAGFFSALKKAPPSKVIIMYQEGSPETFMFTTTLVMQLGMAGWEVPKPTGMASIVSDRGAALAEIVFVMRSLDHPSPSVQALREALIAGGQKKLASIRDASLPDDTLRLLIGPKL